MKTKKALHLKISFLKTRTGLLTMTKKKPDLKLTGPVKVRTNSKSL